MWRMFLLCCIVLKAADIPGLSARDIVNAADRSAGKVAPGEIVVLFPSNAGPELLAPYRLIDGKITDELSDTRVWFDGIPAPINYSVKGQVGAVVPYEIAGRRSTNITVEYKGVRSAPVVLPVVNAAPALFTLDSSGKGQAAMLNHTGCCNSIRNPAARGDWAALYATGEGQTTPPGITGFVSTYPKTSDYPIPQKRVRVTVGGVPAEILWVGEAPHTVTGLLQINIRVPRSAPVGDAVPLVLTIGDVSSSPEVTMAVRSAVKRILIIEPESATRVWLRKLLVDFGYVVIAADRAPQAIEENRGRYVDLVISGSGISASDVAETLQQLPAGRPQVKLAAIATALDSESLKSADLIGAQTVIAKSMSGKVVLRRVYEILKYRPTPYMAGQAPVSLDRGIAR
jgi:uncharacterized protein (TIGR03437 family)